MKIPLFILGAFLCVFGLGVIFKSIEPKKASKIQDPQLSDGYFGGSPSRALSGSETVDLNNRIRSLRVSEMRGVLFQQLAKAFIKNEGDTQYVEDCIKAAHAAAKKIAEDSDEFGAAFIIEGANQFETEVRKAIAEATPTAQRKEP